MKRRIEIIIITLFAVVTFFYSQFIVHADSGNSASFNIISLSDKKISYISMVDLAEKYNVKISYNPLMLSMTARRGNSHLTVMHQSRIALFNDAIVNMVFPAQLIQGALFAPISTFLPLFSRLIPGTLAWDEKKKEIDISGVIYSINKVAFENREGGTLIRIALSEPLKYSEKLTDNNWLHLRFSDGTFNPVNLFENESAGLVQETRLFEYSGEARLSFRISDEFENYSITKTSDPEELLISLRYKRTGEPNTPKQSKPDITPLPPPVNEDLWIIDTIVIDPGHGGKDGGAVGPGGTKEKDIVLKIAKELKKIIDERKEIKAVLTRDRDVFIPLKERSEIAYKANGKLFISIHANAHPNKSISGMEVYFLSAAKTESAQRVADLENASIKFEDNPEYYYNNADILTKIRWDMASNVYLKESQNICTLLLDNATSATKLSSRGIKQAGFYVMLGTQAIMPSVLFEIGYISNPNEEKILRRVSYQKRLAEAMYDAIIEFKKRAERDLISRGD